MSSSAFALQKQKYLGQVATRCGVLTNFINVGSTIAQINRSYHYIRDDVFGLQIVLQQWYSDSTGEHNAGGSCVRTASVELPSGLIVGFKFNGAAQVTIADGGTVYSDVLPIYIPRGTKIFVRHSFWGQFSAYREQTANGNCDYLDTANGDAVNYPADQATAEAQVLSGTITDNGGTAWTPPSALLGMTSRPSFFVMGDSKIHGYSDAVTANVGDMGEACRSVGPKFGYINCGTSSDTIANWVGGSATKRLVLAKFCSHIITDLGYADINFNGVPQATVQANLRTFWASVAPRPIWQDTYGPVSPAADGQTLDTTNTARNSLNASFFTEQSLAGAIPVGAVLDAGGTWTPGTTTDGAHPTPAGYTTEMNANLFNHIALTKISPALMSVLPRRAP